MINTLCFHIMCKSGKNKTWPLSHGPLTNQGKVRIKKMELQVKRFILPGPIDFTLKLPHSLEITH